jgi:adenylyltransferase/sulfurtransferase
MKFRTPEEINQKLEEGNSVYLLDIREPYELDICKIDSVHIPMAEVVGRLEELPKEDDIVVICRTGQRAEALCNVLEMDCGLANTSVLEGGIMAWREKINSELEAY